MTRAAAHVAVRFVAVAVLSLAAGSCRPRQPPSAVPPPPPPGVAVPNGPRPEAAPIDRALTRPDVIAVSAPLPGFMKGINLGNCLEAPREGAWGSVISEKHFEMAAAAGFDHVRLPVRFTTPERSLEKPPYTVREEFFQRVDWAVDQALSHHLSIIVDVHHFEAIHKDPNANKERFYAIWRQIATRYQARPPEVAFEILNEPNGALEPVLLNQITAEALRIIRERNPTRLVFADGYFWASADHIATLELPADDPNVVAQFHMYQPILFTHQGAPWMEPWYQTQGIIFPAPPSAPVVPVQAAHSQTWVEQWFTGYNQLPPDQNPGGPRTVFEHFDHAARWVKEHNQRIYLGEFGAIDAADQTSRENYVWLVRTEAERRGIGWAYWDDGGRFQAMNVRTASWNEGLRRALFD